MSGNGGAAVIPGTDGNETDDDGDNGDDGEELPAEIYCLRLTDFIDLIGATILPGLRLNFVIDLDLYPCEQPSLAVTAKSEPLHETP